ncbi:MAG TPA: hypothetical protein VNZ52_01540 [Candidatus Thermoplasmatota archaeon]|nr:hypothetical protein [Candidatus Thermoplasmatota archaeon]
MSLWTLYMEELRAIPRGRFALAGAALVLLLVTFAGAVPGVEDEDMEFFFVLTCLFIPTAFAALAALPLATARSTRFIQSVFTAPVGKGEYLAAKTLVALTLGLAYFVALLPFVMVHVYHLGWPAGAIEWLLVCLGVVLYSTALGTFLGVVFTGRSTAAPVALGVGLMFLSLMSVFFLWTVLEGDHSETTKQILIRLVHLGPHASLLDATGLHPPVQASAPHLSLAAYLVSVVGLFGAAAWIFLREQGVETWEVAPSHRGLVAALIAGVFLAPMLLTGTTYAAANDNDDEDYADLFRPSEKLWVRLTDRGAPSLTAGFGAQGGFTENDLTIGETQELDLLVLFPVKPGTTLTNVRITLAATPSLNLEGPRTLTLDRTTSQEQGPIPKPGAWEADVDTSERGLVLRIPVTVRPEAPTGLGDTLYGVNATATYRASGVEGLQEGFAQTRVAAEIATASLQMWLAGAPAVLGCTVSALRRKLRVG